MSTINIGRPPHLSNMQTICDHARDCHERNIEISDAAAATIASWWQSPGRQGRHLASLAMSGQVDRDDLLEDIADVRNDPTYARTMTPCDQLCLDMLATWAISKTRSEP